MANDMAESNVPNVEAEIKAIAKTLKRTPTARATQLTSLALCSLKYLVTRSESDQLRLAATRTILELPIVQARLGVMTKRIQEYHQHLHVGDPTSKALVERLTEALASGQTKDVIDLLVTEKSTEIVAKPMETNGNR